MSQIIYQTITTIKNTEKSQVCLAFMEGREEMVIIKRMNIANPEVYKALTEVHNEHIPQIYAWEWQENELVVAEEYIDGETLEYYLREGLLTEEQKLKIALQLCEAVKVLHNCVPQIIHRDIKPSNVLLTEDGVLKLIDYDASRQYKKESEGSDTRILGTANYAAPEQFGYQQTDVRSDIYSMGVVFEMLHFHGDGLAKLAWKKMLGICTNFDPKKRYKSINGLAKAIRRIRLLQNYQWYGLGCLFCMVFLIGMCAGWTMKPMGDKGKLPDTQVIMTTQGTIETDISESEPQESTETDVSDSESQESTDTSMPELYEEADEETLTAIKNMLETQSLYVSEYFKCEKNVDYFMYSDFFENDIEVRDATLFDLVSKEYVNLKDNLKIENAILIIGADYMQTLKPSYYKLQINLLDKRERSVHTYDSYIRVYSEKEPFREKEEALETDWLDYHYKKYDTLHIIGYENSKSKITDLYITNYGRVDESLYTILYDGRAAELSAGLLEICKNAKETCFEVVFDDGKRETLTIVNPYLQ